MKPLTAELHLHANCLAASFFHAPQRTVIKRPIQCPATCAFHSLCHSQDEARMLHWVEASVLDTGNGTFLGAEMPPSILLKNILGYLFSI